jgi:hypothetical protein
MANHRTHSIEFKRQVAQELLAGGTLHGLAKLLKPDSGLGSEVRGRRLFMRMPPPICSGNTKPGSRRSNVSSASRRWSSSF